LPLTRQLNNMGMPLYGAQPPTGYSMKAETWVSSSALLNRMNFALALTNGKIKGVKVDAAQLAGSGARLRMRRCDAFHAGRKLDGWAMCRNRRTTRSQRRLSGRKERHAAKQDADKLHRASPTDAARPPDVNTIAGFVAGFAGVSEKIALSDLALSLNHEFYLERLREWSKLRAKS
jgi:hypothetical protein